MIDISKKQEETIKNDNKEIDKMWKEISEIDTLEKFLEKMTKDELVNIGKKYFVKGLTSLKKADVVERIKNTILNSNKISIELMDEEVLNFLQGLLKNNGPIKYEATDIMYTTYLRNRGITFSGSIKEEAFIAIPEDLKEALLKNISKECQEVAKNNTEVIKAIGGMAYYYGVISIDKVLEDINKLFGTNQSKEDILKRIAIAEELGYDYILDGNNICSIDVEDVDAILELQNQKELNYAKFDKKSLVKAGEKDYIEIGKQGEKLKKVFAELFVVDKKILAEEMGEFVAAIRNEMNIEEAIEIFLQAYQIETDEESEIFTEELQTFAKSIKRWSYKGHSQDEVEKNSKRVINTVVIGRNDPCTCGSGKKYKKCCGR